MEKRHDPLSHNWGERNCISKSVNPPKIRVNFKGKIHLKALVVIKIPVLLHRVMIPLKTNYFNKLSVKVTFIPDCVLFPSVRPVPTVLYQLHGPAAPAFRVLPNRLVRGGHRSPLHHDHKEHLSYLHESILLGFWAVLTPQISVRISLHSILQNYLGKWYFNNLKNNSATPPCSPVNYEINYLPFLPSCFTCCYGLVKWAGCWATTPFPQTSTLQLTSSSSTPLGCSAVTSCPSCVLTSGTSMDSHAIIPPLCPHRCNEHAELLICLHQTLFPVRATATSIYRDWGTETDAEGYLKHVCQET